MSFKMSCVIASHIQEIGTIILFYKWKYIFRIVWASYMSHNTIIPFKKFTEWFTKKSEKHMNTRMERQAEMKFEMVM